MPPKKKDKAAPVAEPTAPLQPAEQSENGHSNPSEKDRRRPSIGDMWGRPPQGGGDGAAAALQITRDQQNWLATGILTDRQVAMAARMLAKQMSRHGRLDMERLVFQLGHLARSREGFSLKLWAQVKGVEMKQQRAFNDFYGRFNPQSMPQQAPQGGQ